MDIINKKKSGDPSGQREITKPESLRFKFDINANRKKMGPQTTGQTRWPQSASNYCSEIIKRTGGRNYIEFNESKARSSTEQKITNTSEQNKNEPEPISNTEESEVAKSSSNFPIVELKDYDIAEKTIQSIQINHVIEKLKMKSTEAHENLKKAELNFMIDLKTLIHKTSVDTKLLQLKICVRNKQKEKAFEKFSPVFSKITKRLGLLFAGEKIVVPEELKRQVVDALLFGQPG